MIDFIYGLTPGDVAYDIETHPNVFTCTFKHCVTGDVWVFEISPRKNETKAFVRFLWIAKSMGCRLVGFNNIGFDYPVIHMIYEHWDKGIGVADIYNKAMSIIQSFNNFGHMVWESDWIMPQIDLYKIHHFDNRARATSLKVLEFNMKMYNIEDLPFGVGIELANEEIDVLLAYNLHDVNATVQFYNLSKDQIRFREELSLKYGRNFLNHNDTKIGKDYFIMKLEEHTPECCYRYVNGKREVVQTPRERIDIGQVILPMVQFEHPEFQRIQNYLAAQVITETKGTFTDVNCTVNGFKFDFGTGGIHGSVESTHVTSDEEYMIEDWDVASYYPNLAIVNNLYPEHLGQTFCTIYKDVYEQRKAFAKGTAENAMLKLALNGVYGDSNNQYSPFYDPKYTMSITINGQLLLCMFAEQLMKHPELQMIQINTDGLTIRYPRRLQSWVAEVSKWWEMVTRLTLENVEYSDMWIRDVNNYIAKGVDGKLKRKGAYEHRQPHERNPLGWHQDMSALVVPKAAEAAMVEGKDVREFIQSHSDIFDFFLRAKATGGAYLEWGGEPQGKILRYYVSKDGDFLEKVMAPVGPVGQYKKANKVSQNEYEQWHQVWGNTYNPELHTKNKSIYEERRTQLHTGWTVVPCNNLRDHLERDTFDGVVEGSIQDINIDWYVQEAEKLVIK